jgi:hypothetical protein
MAPSMAPYMAHSMAPYMAHSMAPSTPIRGLKTSLMTKDYIVDYGKRIAQITVSVNSVMLQLHYTQVQFFNRMD